MSRKGLKFAQELGIGFLPTDRDVADRICMAQDLLKIREWKGIPKSVWMRRAKAGRHTSYKIEHGEFIPTVQLIWRLLKALRISRAEAKEILAELDLSEVTKHILSNQLENLEEYPDRRDALRRNVGESVGKRIREIREKQSMTQLQLSELSLISKGLIWQLETGRYLGKVDNYYGYLRQIAIAMGLPEDEFYPRDAELKDAVFRQEE